MIVAHASLHDFRSYAALELDLPAGLVLVVGPNGVGKTNLLEALHVGSQGFSPRTRAEARLLRFDASAARVGLTGHAARAPVATEVTLRRGAGKDVRLNGATLAGPEELRARLATLAFTPDRLAVVKGGPLVRRTYLDRMLGRLLPARAALPGAYGHALAQRNAALRRAGAGLSERAAVAPWTAQLAELGTALERARAEAAALVAPGFADAADALGLAGAAIAYEERPLVVADLEARLDRDLDRGTTGAGPHLRDVAVTAAGRELRLFGSQGEQRVAVLALLLAEAEQLADRRGTPPLLLLDDVLSELDRERRAALLRRLPADGQAVLTATSRGELPDGAAPAAVVTVAPGEATLL